MPKPISVLHVADGGDSSTQAIQSLGNASASLSVSRVDTAADALAYLDADGADCVVIESGEDGLDRLDSVQSAYPDVPCILATDDDSETVRRALAAGAADCLRAGADRPTTELLVARIENVVEARSQPQPDSDARLVDELTDGVLVLDEDRTIRDANGAVGEIFGTDVAALRGQPVSALAEAGHLEDSDLTRWRDGIDTVLTGSESTRIEFTVEESSRTYDAGLAPRSGRAGGVVVTIRDVTERVAREDELERYETLLRTIPDTVVLMDTDGYHAEVHGFEGWSGYTRSDLIGEHFSMTTTDEHVQRANDVAADLFRDDDREKATFEMEVETSDGSLVPFENHLTLLPPDEDGHIPGTMSVLRNISDRKERERQLNGLNERLRDIVGADSPEGMAENAVRAARDVLGFDFAAVRFYDEDADGLARVATAPDVATWPGGPPAGGAEVDPLRAAFEADEMQIYRDDSPADGEGDGDATARTDLVFPLGDHGVVQFGTTGRADLADREVSLAEILAGNLESALDRAFSLAELEERERVLERYETVVESTHDGIAIVDEHNEHLLVNDVYAEALGVDRDEILGATLDEVVPDTLTREVPDDFEEQWRDARETATEEGHTEFRYESIAELPRGRTVLDNRVTAIKQEDGTVVYVVVGRDITDQYERLAQIEELHAATRELMTAESKDQVAAEVVEAVDTILGFPANVVRLLDDEGEQLAPVTVTDRARDLLGDRSSLSVEDSRLGEAFREGEVLLHSDIRTYIDREPESDVRSLLGVPIGDYGLLSIVDDEVGAYDEADIQIAEIVAANAEAAFDRVEKEAALRERKETLARQNERLDRFASILSHDLRNPLNVAQGNLTFVAEQVDDTEHVDDVAGALDRIDALIDDVLTLTRQGDDVTDVGPVALRRTVESCWESVDTADATLALETEQTVLADERRLRQLFENLIRNGIDHAGRDVTITVGDTADGFYVADDGPGIPPEDRESVFDAGYSSSSDGTGFGLDIVRTVAESHGWDVSVTEGQDGGARFEFAGVGLASR